MNDNITARMTIVVPRCLELLGGNKQLWKVCVGGKQANNRPTTHKERSAFLSWLLTVPVLLQESAYTHTHTLTLTHTRTAWIHTQTQCSCWTDALSSLSPCGWGHRHNRNMGHRHTQAGGGSYRQRLPITEMVQTKLVVTTEDEKPAGGVGRERVCVVCVCVYTPCTDANLEQICSFLCSPIRAMLKWGMAS